MNLYRIRATYPSSAEDEPQFIVATCPEAAAEVWFDINLRDTEDPCELLITQIRSAEEALPA